MEASHPGRVEGTNFAGFDQLTHGYQDYLALVDNAARRAFLDERKMIMIFYLFLQKQQIAYTYIYHTFEG